MIDWNNGLSLGVEAIDKDHKKLLEIVNRLSYYIENDPSPDIINEIFSDLEEYGTKHFHREESYMKKCNYPELEEHIKQHRDFVKEIPKLKEKVFNSKDKLDIHEVSTFLTEWLINHIINEDMQLTTLFEKNGFTKQKKKEVSILNRVIENVTRTIDFAKRILFSTMIPLIGMIILGFIIIFNTYTQYYNMKETSNITNIIHNVNNLIHTLQIERGLSSGHITSKSDKFKDLLIKQYDVVDKEIKYFNAKTNKNIDIDNMSIIKFNIKRFNDDITNLEKLREKIIRKEITYINSISIYTTIIDNILKMTDNIALSKHEVELATYISTLASISHFKESLGLQRAYGTIIIEQQSATIQEYITFIQLMGNQKNHLNIFELFRTQKLKNISNDILKSKQSKQVKFYENQIINKNFKDLNSKTWFNLTTSIINKIKILETELLNKINNLVDNNIEKSKDTLVFWVFIIIVTLIITFIIVYLFEYSSRKELDKFTDAMEHLAYGERDIKLDHIPKKGSMSKMYISYELTRQKLLEGDIYTELFKKQKEIEIKRHQELTIKLEELASIDPLTGCINRRKFETLSNNELQKSIRYKNELSFLMLDIDHFKKINDTYGHAIGDEVLKHFSSVCLKLARNIDVVARIGGEEFIVMLPETNIDGAYTFAQRFREEIYNSTITIDNHIIKYSVSIGISPLDIKIDTDVATILHRADLALYEAKESGRNKCVIKVN